MQNPVVEVQEITDEAAGEHDHRGVSLGDATNVSVAIAEANVNDLIDRNRRSGGRMFLLSWEGNLVPRGARVLSHVIAWTQNGLVVSIERDYIGTYNHIVEFGGASGKQQKMLVCLYRAKSS